MTVPRWLCRTAAVTIVLAVMAAIAAIGYSNATAATAPPQPCPPAQQAATCIKGTLIIWEDPAHQALNQLIQEDNSGAPQFSVGVGAAVSWANPVCVTNNPRYSKLGYVLCLGGPSGNGQGQPVLILYEERGGQLTGRSASLDFNRLAWLDRWLAKRGIR